MCPQLSVLSVPARPRPHDRRLPFLRSHTRRDGSWDLGLVRHSGRCMSDTIRRLDRTWSPVRFSIYRWTFHLSNFEAEASNVVRGQQYHLDMSYRDGQAARCDKWDKGDSLLYDDRSIRRFVGYFPQIQSNLVAVSPCRDEVR